MKHRRRQKVYMSRDGMWKEGRTEYRECADYYLRRLKPEFEVLGTALPMASEKAIAFV